MKHFKFLIYGALLTCLSTCTSTADRPVPNVLFIAIDDMNDWTTLFDPSNPIRVPNLEKLANRGTFFTQAYCNAPACNPSRASVLSGVRPSTSGVYGNASDWKTALKDVDLLPAHFRKNGYRTYCAGKIFHHHGSGFVDYTVFDEYLPFPADRPPDSPMPEGNLNGVQYWYDEEGNKAGKISPNFDWGVWPKEPDNHIDNQTVKWAIDRMEDESEAAFFMAVGIFRPHMPFFVPQSFLNIYPLDELQLPVVNPNDFEDLPQGAVDFIKKPRYKWMSTFRHEEKRDSLIFEEAVRAYQASATFADHQVGRLLEALDRSGHRDNTIVVLWSDHGYHLGEKDHWEKFVLYEKATHIPLIIAGPNLPGGQRISSPVSLIDLYPTLTDFCGLPRPNHLEGSSLLPFLGEPITSTSQPVLTTYGERNHAIRSDEYRYIRLADGSEELYHTAIDKHEWTNLAGEQEYQLIIDSLRKWLPAENASPVPNINRQSR